MSRNGGPRDSHARNDAVFWHSVEQLTALTVDIRAVLAAALDARPVSTAGLSKAASTRHRRLGIRNPQVLANCGTLIQT
jgi:hypothetical protein